MKKNVLFTGGAGKAGRHVVPYLVDHGCDVLNLDLTPLDHPGVDNMTVDVSDSGQVFNAMSGHRNLAGLETGEGPAPFDAVVHFAAIPRILIKPDNETFRINTIGTYNVVEAAVKLGIRKIIIASSETTYGVCFAEGHKDFHQVPLDEDYDVDPMDSYGLSKVCNENTARAFQMRSGADIYALRIGNVIEPHEYESLFPTYLEHPEMRVRNAWCYIDARDLGQIVDRAIRTDGLGFQVFNAVNDTIVSRVPTAELLRRHFPKVPVTRPMGEFEGVISNAKIRDLLGFSEEHDWRRYVSAG